MFHHVLDKVPCLHFELGQLEAGLAVGVLTGTYLELPIEDLVPTFDNPSRQIALLRITTVLELLGQRLATAVFTRPASRLMITSLPENAISGVATIITAITTIIATIVASVVLDTGALLNSVRHRTDDQCNRGEFRASSAADAFLFALQWLEDAFEMIDLPLAP
jgi:hypothetical protein